MNGGMVGAHRAARKDVRGCATAPISPRTIQQVLSAAHLRRKGHEIWEVTDPANPVKLSSIGGNYQDTHKNWWECETGIAYLVSAVPGWRAKRMTEIYDLKDPSSR